MAKFVQQKLKEKQEAAAAQYNKSVKSKPELVQGQSVRLYDKQRRRWEPALVTGRASTPRSYMVQRLSGGEPLRRNRVHLRSTRESFPEQQHTYPEELEEEEEVSRSVTSRNSTAEEPAATPTQGADNELDAAGSPAGLRRSVRPRRQTQFYQA